MPEIIHCPSCNRRLRLPDNLQNQPVQCPTCGQTFTATATGASAPDPGPESARPSPPAGEGYGLQPEATDPSAVRGERVACPACGASNAVEEEHCLRCGAELAEEEEEEDDEDEEGDQEKTWQYGYGVRRDAEPHRGPLILTLAIISLAMVGFSCFPVGLPLGICAWSLGQSDLARMERRQMDVRGRSLTHAAWICGIIGTVLNCLWLFFCGGWILLMFLGSFH
jgi:hypothetical protein